MQYFFQSHPRRWHSAICVAVLVLAAEHAPAAEFAGYVALATDYVKRGVTQSDGNPVVQLGADVSFDSGFYVGAWGSTIDISNGPTRQRDVEVDYYAGYLFKLSDSWRAATNIVSYNYPGQSGNVDYDYREYSFAVSYDDRVWLEYAYSPDLYHSGQSSRNVDVFAEWPLRGAWLIGAGAGYYDTSNLTGRSYYYWQLGVTGSFKWADVDIRYHDTDRPVPIVSNADRAEARVVLKIQIPF
ncbi:MAG: TorF family putative porin [Gammaproteobacteria bacterium]|nr:TorF family putative porin [Gammaproteobacteria bacterium]